jgi:hypothetical protein
MTISETRRILLAVAWCKEFDMRPISLAALLVLSVSLALAQDQNIEDQSKKNFCNGAAATTIGHDAGVIVEKVVLSGKWGRNEATVYLPAKEIADGAVVFSHSAIDSDTGALVDLLPFALTLAQAGAAVIVRQGTLKWLPIDRSANREGAAAICAEHWLIDHTRVFNDGEPTVNEQNIVVREGYAYVGPRLCDPAVASDCDYTDPFAWDDCALKHYCRPNVWVPVGETEGGDNTRGILSDGGLWAARSLERVLGLAQIGALASGKSASGL